MPAPAFHQTPYTPSDDDDVEVPQNIRSMSPVGNIGPVVVRSYRTSYRSQDPVYSLRGNLFQLPVVIWIVTIAIFDHDEEPVVQK